MNQASVFGCVVLSGLMVIPVREPVERPPGSAIESARPVTRAATFAEIYKFPLRPTARARGASGTGELKQPQSPFGAAVTVDGFPVFDLEVTVKGLRPPGAVGAGAYVAWITTPELDRVERLGAIDPAGLFTYRVSTMNKFILMITLEPSPDVAKRSGPVVLRGISPSGLLQSFASHELFNNMPHDRE